jgi:Icc protein
VRKPVYFVLGNHDFYHGSISVVRMAIQELGDSPRWLGGMECVPLTDTTCLVGHDGWGDGRYGNYAQSDVALNDFRLIRELRGLSRPARLAKMMSLGDEAAEHFRRVLPEALAASEHVVVLTHVSPFVESCIHEGRPSDADWLPFFACKAAGDVLLDAMRRRPDRRMTVLCGHTHGRGTCQVLPNLEVHTGGAEYGQPTIQKVFEWM